MNIIDSINIYFKSKQRNKNSDIINNGIWNEPYAGTYFKDRYHFYLDYLLDNTPNIFILPSLQTIGATGLIYNRCSKLQPCGLVFDETFVDESVQSPCNFFWHDLNHTRRIYQNNLWYINQHKITFDDFHEEMRKTTKAIIPINNWLKDDDKKYERVIKILLFEVVHEDALPFLKDQIEKNILYTSGTCYPYERTFYDIDKNNITSRVNFRFYEQGASMLRTLYNKIRHEFFEKETPVDSIVQIEMRYIKPIIDGTKLLLKKINTNYNSDNSHLDHALKCLITDKNFATHDHKKLIGLDVDPDDK